MALSGASGGGGSASAVRAGGAFVELFTKNKALEAGLSSARRRVAQFASEANKLTGAGLGGLMDAAGGLARGGLVGVGAGTLAAGLTASAVAAGVLAKSVSSLSDTARVGEVATAFGVTAEKMSGLLGVMEAAGSGAKESIESLTQFGTAISDAVEGKGGNAAELFQILGRSAEEFARADIVSNVYGLFAAIERVNDPLQKMRALSLAFGTDGMKLLLPMLNRTNAELQRQAGLYQQTTAEVKQATAASYAMTASGAAVERAWRAVASALAPTVQAGAEWLTRAAAAVTQFVPQLKQMAQGAAEQAANWAQAQIEIAGFGRTLNTLKDVWGGVADAVAGRDLQLAAQVAFKGIEVEWQRTVNTMRATFAKFWEKGGYFDQFRKGWVDAMAAVDAGGNAAARTGLKWLTEPLNAVQGWIDKQLGNVEPGAGRKNTRLVYDPKTGWQPAAGPFEAMGRELNQSLKDNDAALEKGNAELRRLSDELAALRAQAAARAANPLAPPGGPMGPPRPALSPSAVGAMAAASQFSAGGARGLFLGGSSGAAAALGPVATFASKTLEVEKRQLQEQERLNRQTEDLRRMLDRKLSPLFS